MARTAGALFLYTEWNKDMCGLTGFHRRVIQEFCVRKAQVGQSIKAYSTVLSLEITDDQRKDAARCGVILIPAQRRKYSDDEVPELNWLTYYNIHYPDIHKLENIQYVVGYAPKTGEAADTIREKLFPYAKLVLINHVCPGEKNLLGNENEEQKLSKKMLELASEADILFSIGPKIYQHFKNEYRVKLNGKQLSDIPHEEILPKPESVFFDIKQTIIPDDTSRNILTYGEDDTPEALNKCDVMAQSIGKVANIRKENRCSVPDWKIQGISPNAKQEDRNELVKKMKSSDVQPKFYPDCSVGALMTSLQQSHLCLPSPYYKDYGLQGLEAIAAGLPTRTEDDSQLACLMTKHFKYHANECIIRDLQEKLYHKKILETLEDPDLAFQKAKMLKESLNAHQDIFLGSAKLTSLLTDKALQQTRMNSRVQGVAEKRKTTSKPKKLGKKLTIKQQQTQEMQSEANRIGAQKMQLRRAENPRTQNTNPTKSAISKQEGEKPSQTKMFTKRKTKAKQAKIQRMKESPKSSEISRQHTKRQDTSSEKKDEATEAKKKKQEIREHDTSVPPQDRTGLNQDKIKATQGENTETSELQKTRTSESEDQIDVTQGTQKAQSKPMTTYCARTGHNPHKTMTLHKMAEPESVSGKCEETQAEKAGKRGTGVENPGEKASQMLTGGELGTEKYTGSGEGEQGNKEPFMQQEGTNLETEKPSQTKTLSGKTTEAKEAKIQGMKKSPRSRGKSRHHTKRQHASSGEKGKATRAKKRKQEVSEQPVMMGETAMAPQGRTGLNQHKIKATQGGNTETGQTSELLRTRTSESEVTEIDVTQGTQKAQSKPMKTYAMKSHNPQKTMALHKMGEPGTVSGRCEETQAEKAEKRSNGVENPGEMKYEISTGREPGAKKYTGSEEEQQQGSNELKLTIGVNKEHFRQEGTANADAALTDCQNGLQQSVEEMLASEGGRQGIVDTVKENLGDVDPYDLTADSLGILLRLPGLYNLYRLKQTCKSTNLAKAFEPLLITDGMREIAAKVGITLQLKATYNKATFKEVELFFINRDGGGVKPVEVYTDFKRKNIEEIHFDADGEDNSMKTEEKATLCKQQASQTEIDMTGRKPSQLLLLEIDPKDEIQHLAERFAPLIFNSGTYTRWKGKHYDILQVRVKMTGQVQHVLSCRPEILTLLGVRRYLVRDTDGADLSNTDLEEVVTGRGTPIMSRIDVTPSVSIRAGSLLLCDDVRPKQHKMYDISYYLDLAVTSLNKNSKFKIESSEIKRMLEEKIFALQTEKDNLENRLAEAQQQRLVLENQNRESTLARQSAESVAAKQLTDIHSLKHELENLNPKKIEKEIRALEDRIKEKDEIIDDFKYKLSKLHVSDVKQDAELQEKIAEILGEDYPLKEPEKGMMFSSFMSGGLPSTMLSTTITSSSSSKPTTTTATSASTPAMKGSTATVVDKEEEAYTPCSSPSTPSPEGSPAELNLSPVVTESVAKPSTEKRTLTPIASGPTETASKKPKYHSPVTQTFGQGSGGLDLDSRLRQVMQNTPIFLRSELFDSPGRSAQSPDISTPPLQKSAMQSQSWGNSPVSQSSLPGVLRDQHQSGSSSGGMTPSQILGMVQANTQPSAKVMPGNSDMNKGTETGTPLRDEEGTPVRDEHKSTQAAAANPIEFLSRLITSTQQAQGGASSNFLSGLSALTETMKSAMQQGKQASTSDPPKECTGSLISGIVKQQNAPDMPSAIQKIPVAAPSYGSSRPAMSSPQVADQTLPNMQQDIPSPIPLSQPAQTVVSSSIPQHSVSQGIVQQSPAVPHQQSAPVVSPVTTQAYALQGKSVTSGLTLPVATNVQSQPITPIDGDVTYNVHAEVPQSEVAVGEQPVLNVPGRSDMEQEDILL